MSKTEQVSSKTKPGENAFVYQGEQLREVAFPLGGIGAAVLTTVVGMIVSARRRSRMISWPALGWAIFIITFVAGGLLLNAGVGG